MSAASVAVPRDHVDVLEAVIRERNLKPSVGLVVHRLFLRIVRAVELPGVFNGTGFFDISPIRRVVGEGLQVALADRRRLIAVRRQHIDERVGRRRQDAAVIAETMHARVAAGHEGGPVRHADGRGGVEILEPHAIRRECVQMRRFHHRRPRATEPVGPVLIRHNKDEAGTFAHCVGSVRT